MQGQAKERFAETTGWRQGHPSERPPCGDATSCVCRSDSRVTVADLERMARALGMRLSDLVA